MTVSSLNWDHLRIFLAVMRARSLRSAAADLGVSHPTMSRRLQALEEQLGLRLLETGGEGVKPTVEAMALLEKAEQVEAAMHAFTRCAENVDPALSGTIRVTAPDMIMSEVLAPDLAAFSRQWPDLVLDVETTYDLADLSGREADIAIRLITPGQSPDERLAGRKATGTATAVYGTGDFWLGWRERAVQQEWVRKTEFADLPIRGVLNNIYLQRAACVAGMGMAILPCFMADGLVPRRSEPIPGADLWVLVHPDLRHNPRLRLFRDHIVDALRGHHDLLMGLTGAANQWDGASENALGRGN
ncbi:LysR family transcriptional regulator [Acanthopleuribacter pedis]|uniref:LysR family transcriptional regulator n=1 Tax=Acanthopleuribacter pedis TaxID=442870 RepID=A0A8J7QD40_9BACT|nr:LysR family transcriptional regulator [Acanthopleuribacter pedis]MBO1321924.1 LysR family transcriptional regulator [Acanthopleuribacter pedis]